MLEKCVIDTSLTVTNVEDALHLVSTPFLKQTFEAVKSGKSSEIQTVLNVLESESTDVRQFSAQMTEWIVDNIGEAFEQKSFPLHREIFDLFTQIFVQSKQVAIPMDILRMSLYERIQDTVTPIIRETIPAETPKNKEIESQIHAVPITEAELPSATHELPVAKKELTASTHTIEAPMRELSIPSHELPPAMHEIEPPKHMLPGVEHDIS
jgi:hypothetical protein